jgi:hypothetical protein
MARRDANSAAFRRPVGPTSPSGPRTYTAPLAAVFMALALPAGADIAGVPAGQMGSGMGHAGSHVMVPPPASIMGATMIPQGSFMVNFIPMWMHMDGLQDGTDRISDAAAVTTVPNRFAGQPMPGYPMMKQPAYLRAVPTDMDMSGQMLGFMYGLTDSVNLMVMGTYLQKSMTMQVYKGATGSVPLGTSKASTEGFGDTVATAMVRLLDRPNQEVHFNLGIGLPTGDITQSGTMLMPNGMRMNMRLAYGMQLGDGTYDFLPSLVYTGRDKAITWGAILRGRYPMDNNDEGWRIGNLTQLTAWGGYDFDSHFTGTLRIAGTTVDSIHGQDPLITGPSPGANPDFYGGDMAEAFVGLIAKFKTFGNHQARIAAEVGMPFYQDLNGVQLAQSWSLSLSLMAHF